MSFVQDAEKMFEGGGQGGQAQQGSAPQQQSSGGGGFADQAMDGACPCSALRCDDADMCA
jgi:hypothetical protein